MSEPEFERTVTEAVRSVPERFKKALSNIAITVADEPTDSEYVSMTHGDGELLGLYQGTPITQRTTGYAGVLPDRITIFKGPMNASAPRMRRWSNRFARPCSTSWGTISDSMTSTCTPTATDAGEYTQ